MTESDARDSAVTYDAPMLLYDGTCGLCARSVQFVLRHEDRVRTLRFASLQGAYGSDVRARHPELEGVDSIIWYSPAHGARAERVLVRSDAAMEVLSYLGGAWRVLGAFVRLVPRTVRDAVYDLIARHRHRLVSNDVCVVPTAEQRARFPEMT